MSRRDQIAMSPEEVASFLDQQRVVICATNGSQGWPHLMPLWYVVRGEDLWAWTYAKSQKVRNLERDPRATLQIEAGEQYHELRGVMIEARTTLHRDLDLVSEFGAELFERYAGGAGDDGGKDGGGEDEGGGGGGPKFLEVIRAQAAKRVALQFVAQRTATWDHSKLGGTY
ncbi:MAG TPA: pyridoxamine 5'-phosphate oxidase family protein [Solirubrobacteraceae bacterium]